MSQVFSDIPQVIVYMDDLLVGSVGPEEHLQILEEVLRRMADVGLQTNSSKAQLCQREVKFLGHEVSQDQISLRQYVREQCRQLPMVSTRREIRRILGIMNLCRPCCRDLARIVEPLQKAVKASPIPDRRELEEMTKVAWGKILASNLKISLSAPGEELFLECDWSQSGRGYVLYRGPPSGGRIIAINSRRHSEQGLSSYLGELKTIQWALAEIKTISAGTMVNLFTDSQSSSLRLSGTPSAADLTDSRVSRAWAWILENFLLPGRLRISFIPGLNNATADLLSRWSGSESKENHVSELNLEARQVRDIHEEGHWGVEGTRFRLEERGIKVPDGVIRAVVRECGVCLRFRPPLTSDPLGEPPYSLLPGEVIFFDVVGPTTAGRGGVRFICNLIDSASRWGQSVAAKAIDGEVVIRCLEKWTKSRGPFKRLVSDGASYNQSARVRDWCQQQGAEQIFSPPHSHKSLGLVERYQRTLVDRVRKMAMHRGGSWSDHLPAAVRELTLCGTQPQGGLLLSCSRPRSKT